MSRGFTFGTVTIDGAEGTEYNKLTFSKAGVFTLKYMKQLGVILVISLAGEALNHLIPLPVPASIYGLLLMLAALCLKIVRVSDVKETAVFLIETMPMMFIPATVGLMTAFDILRPHLPAYVVIIISTTLLVMAVSGLVTQALMGGKEKK